MEPLFTVDCLARHIVMRLPTTVFLRPTVGGVRHPLRHDDHEPAVAGRRRRRARHPRRRRLHARLRLRHHQGRIAGPVLGPFVQAKSKFQTRSQNLFIERPLMVGYLSHHQLRTGQVVSFQDRLRADPIIV